MASQNFSLDSIGHDSFPARTSSTPRREPSSYRVAVRGDAASVGGSNNSSLPAAAANHVDAVRSGMAETDGTPTLADVLLRVGCYPTERGRREDLAAQLLVSGHSAQDIAVVAERVMSQAGQPRIGLAMLLRLLREPERLREAVEDCRALRVHEDGRARKWHPGEADRMRSAAALEDERRRWAEADRTHWIRCRMRDGVPQMVAEAEWAAKNRSS